MRTLLEVRDVSVSFDGFRGSTICLSCHRRARVARRDWAERRGKTTFMDIVTGKTRPDTGQVVGRASGSTCCA